MKLKLCVCIVCIIQSVAKGEIVKVFLASKRAVGISEYALSRPINEAGDLKLSYYSPGKQIGSLKLPISLESICSVAAEEGIENEPFFGAGTPLLLLDEKGRTYIAIFETESEKQVTKRIGIGLLVKLDEKGEVQIGYPYGATTQYKKLIDEIRKCLSDLNATGAK